MELWWSLSAVVTDLLTSPSPVKPVEVGASDSANYPISALPDLASTRFHL